MGLSFDDIHTSLLMCDSVTLADLMRVHVMEVQRGVES